MGNTGPDTVKNINLDISEVTGNYYLAIQEILTNGQASSCNFNSGELFGITYSYTNRGI